MIKTIFFEKIHETSQGVLLKVSHECWNSKRVTSQQLDLCEVALPLPATHANVAKPSLTARSPAYTIQIYK